MRLTRYTEPELRLILDKLRLTLPAQQMPTITSNSVPEPTLCSEDLRPPRLIHNRFLAPAQPALLDAAKHHLIDKGIRLKLEGVAAASDYLTKTMSEQKGGRFGGSVNLLRPDGTPYPGSPFTGGGLPGPWAAAVDGDDNLWISNFAMPSSPIVELCGIRTENCPPGMKTGDQISPPGGYVGGGLQMQTDIDVDPAGDVWAMNNWQDVDGCYANPPEALSTRCGGQGVVVFYGMAKPARDCADGFWTSGLFQRRTKPARYYGRKLTCLNWRRLLLA